MDELCPDCQNKFDEQNGQLLVRHMCGACVVATLELIKAQAKEDNE